MLGLLIKSKLDGGIGFRGLECFNQALVAKQAWRILSQPTCLMSKILRAKYFIRSSYVLEGWVKTGRLLYLAKHLRGREVLLEDFGTE